MSISSQSGLDTRRRRLLLGGLAVGSAGLLQLSCRSSQRNMGSETDKSKIGGNGMAAVPPYRVSLADFGGTPGASPSMLRQAFTQAFAALSRKDGGTLLVPPGLYDFGSYVDGVNIIFAQGLQNIAISAYGATFRATTRAKVMPNMFYFFNFNNITVAGARFVDEGFTPFVDWKGMYCVGVQANKPSRKFRMVDCRAESVLGLFASNNNVDTRQYLGDINLQGDICDAYYGAGCSFISEHVKAELNCHNVRRAFIANALKNADINVTVSNTGNWPGSNGLIALICGGAGMGNVENVRVKVNASGAGMYRGYVHFYHQGLEPGGYMRDIDATVNVVNVSSEPNLFLFDHEANGVLPKTARVWDRIALHGSVTGNFSGRIISTPSVSTSPGSVYVDAKLASLADMPKLPAYFSRKDFQQDVPEKEKRV